MASRQTATTPVNRESEGRHRSGAVARMLRMPVATLRVWERRYALTQPALSPSGQRLYSADDVRRLALLKQLTDSGHAIGSLAALDMAQLLAVASTHASTLASQAVGTPALARPQAQHDPESPRVAVIGEALFRRLQQPALRKHLPRQWQWLGPFADAGTAAQALPGQPLDALLCLEPRLHTGWLAGLLAAAPSWGPLPKGVLYQFAAETTCASLADAGVRLLRGPQADAALAQWLVGWLGALHPLARDALNSTPAGADVPPRRWDDAALAEVAGLSSTIACECPRHVAELLQQLAHFEAYSAECAHRSPADAELHHYLQREAAQARARFEAALEHVARHEGLILPG